MQHTLEYYKLPNKLRQENPDLPEYVRPIFRDMTDLEVGELSQQIHKALEQSHYLIVVCSPRAAQSKWVNDEIEYFISIGKQDKIIPYIIDGIPHAKDPDEECFPPALLALSKEKELLGANINEVGKDSAAIRVVSRMFNIRFDTLFQRYQRERRRKRWAITIVILLIFLLLLSFIGFVVYSNKQLKDKNQLIDTQNKELTSQKEALIISQDSTRSALQRVQLKNDSLIQTRNSLQTTNNLLTLERDNVKRENWKMMEQQARAVAGEAHDLISEGDSYLAQMLLLEVLPNDLNHPDKPYTREADIALRTAYRQNTAILRGHIGAVRSASYSPDGKHIVSASSGETYCFCIK